MKNTTDNSKALAPSIVGVWEIKDDINNLYFMNATSDGQFIMSASTDTGVYHGIYQAEGQNKFKAQNWSFLYNKESQAESIKTANAEMVLCDDGTKLDFLVKISIKDIKTGKATTFESKGTGIRLAN